MQNGVSQFKYSILNDSVNLDVTIKFDEDEEATVEEVTIDGYDVTEEIDSFKLFPKLIEYAEENPDYFTSDEESHAESQRDYDDDR